VKTYAVEITCVICVVIALGVLIYSFKLGGML
jgi:hypothetical protein